MVDDIESALFRIAAEEYCTLVSFPRRALSPNPIVLMSLKIPLDDIRVEMHQRPVWYVKRMFYGLNFKGNH